MPSATEQHNQLKVRAQKKAVMFSEVLGSEIGSKVMAEIKEQFDPEVLVGDNEHKTIIRAAQRDVVRWIEEVINRGKNYDLEG